MTSLADVTALLDSWYPPHTADDWDAVGLVLGDPAVAVERILLAVDPVQAVADEALTLGADLLVVHHPLFLKPVHSLAATTPKGKLAHQLLSNQVALFTAHTNADAPAGGVSEAMALALGLEEVVPLDADPLEPLDKVIFFAPADAAESVRATLAAAGAGAIGDYDSCSFSSTGTGRFRPLRGAEPAVGSVGELSEVAEERVEMVCSRAKRAAVLAALRSAHPYEEPAFDVVELAEAPSADRGSGRYGQLPEPESLADFAERVKAALPTTAHGVRVAGAPEKSVHKVALCGGAGDFLMPQARSVGADVYVTSDLRHHPASELREHDDLALVDVAHYAAESTWLPVLADKLANALGDTVTIEISQVNTDPWTFRA